MPRQFFTPNYSLDYSGSTSAKTTVTSSASVANLMPETNSKFSWSAWIYLYDTKTATVEPRIFDKSQHFLGILTSPQTNARANRIELSVTSATVVTQYYGSTPLAIQKWYHVVSTYDNGTATLYINGVAETITGTGAATLDSSTGSNLFLGNRSGNSRNFPGRIAMPRMFQNKVLSQSEVTALYSGLEITSGLVLRYDFDEQTGTSVTDRSGNAYTGANTGLVNTINDWISETTKKYLFRQYPTKALNFIPASSMVSVTDTALLRPEVTGLFTWSAWVYPIRVDFNDLPFIMQKSSHYICFMGEHAPPNVRNGQFAMELANSSDGLATEFWSSMRLTLNAWNHVIGRFNGTTVQHFINGYKDPVTIVNDNRSFPIEGTSGQPLVFGNRNTALNRNFPGYIGKLRYYNVVLTDDECSRIFRSDDVTRGLIGKWNLDEGSGSTATDTSGNGNNGTITNALWTTLSGHNGASGRSKASGRSSV